MNSLSKLTSAALPVILGLGVAWISIKLIKNEKKLITRKIELQKHLEKNLLKQLT